MDNEFEKHLKEERFWRCLFWLNKAEKRKEIIKIWHLGRLAITFQWKSKRNLWGRFGGGWNWNLGFQAAKGTVIINLLICSLHFHLKQKED